MTDLQWLVLDQAIARGFICVPHAAAGACEPGPPVLQGSGWRGKPLGPEPVPTGGVVLQAVMVTAMPQS